MLGHILLPNVTMKALFFLLYPIESYNSAFNLIFECNLSTIIR